VECSTEATSKMAAPPAAQGVPGIPPKAGCATPAPVIPPKDRGLRMSAPEGVS